MMASRYDALYSRLHTGYIEKTMAAYDNSKQLHGLNQLKSVWQVGNVPDPHFNDDVGEKPATDIYSTPTGSSIPRRSRRRKHRRR